MTRDRKKSFGDFQTPSDLARAVAEKIARERGRFASIFEPSCGIGGFIESTRAAFPKTKITGLEIDDGYVAEARRRFGSDDRVTIRHGNALGEDLSQTLETLPDPLLLIGNPPWVTNAEQGRRGAANLPAKSNFQKMKGLDARTGRANFDVSEWMLMRLLEHVEKRDATMAMLIKTSVARRILAWAWRADFPLARATIHRIDSGRIFDAAVDACLFTCEMGEPTTKSCTVFDDLTSASPVTAFGWANGVLVADADTCRRLAHLNASSAPRWRSGIKHDSAKLLELTRRGRQFVNGHGEAVDLEPRHVFPLLKATDLAHGRVTTCSKWLLVPQQDTREAPLTHLRQAPRASAYLERHAAAFAHRGSSIYEKRPPFSIFGVGPYAFAPYKIATSGLHKKLAFHLVAPITGRPVVLDDTCYFLPFDDEASARRVLARLETPDARAFLAANIFWDAKRPITAGILGRLGLPLA